MPGARAFSSSRSACPFGRAVPGRTNLHHARLRPSSSWGRSHGARCTIHHRRAAATGGPQPAYLLHSSGPQLLLGPCDPHAPPWGHRLTALSGRHVHSLTSCRSRVLTVFFNIGAARDQLLVAIHRGQGLTAAGSVRGRYRCLFLPAARGSFGAVERVVLATIARGHAAALKAAQGVRGERTYFVHAYMCMR